MPSPYRPPLRERLRRFFYGRYGADTLYFFLFGLSLAVCVVGRVLHLTVVHLLSWLPLLYAVWRAMSRNHAKRRKENERFTAFFRRVARPFSLLFACIRYRKTHVFRRCPLCRNTLRLPRVKGAHTVRCPRCNRLFETKIK